MTDNVARLRAEWYGEAELDRLIMASVPSGLDFDAMLTAGPPPGLVLPSVDAAWTWNPAPVKAAFAAALAALLLRWAPVKEAWTAQLTSQVQRAAQDDDVRAFAELGVDATQGADVLHDAMAAYAPVAAGQVVAEAKDQGVAVPPQVPDTDVMATQALVTAELLAAALALSAGNEAQRVHRGDRPAADTAADVGKHLDELSDAVPTAQLGYALHTVELGSRVATMSGHLGVKLYASEQMDDHLCVPCRAVNGSYIGTTGGDLSKLHLLYPNGGFINCRGGINCRGTVIGVWPKEGE